MYSNQDLQILATVFLSLAVLHTFLVKQFEHIALKFPKESIWDNFFHLLGEVEVVFGIWAAAFLGLAAVYADTDTVIAYLESLKFTEPLFVFVIMTICSTKPVLIAAENLLEVFVRLICRVIPIQKPLAKFFVTLTLGPLLGSIITEPAAMTVIALILKRNYYDQEISDRFKYIVLAVLFVNVSVGGVLTPFAAPPVLMVAAAWKWDLAHMLTHFGWRAVLAVGINGFIASLILRTEIIKTGTNAKEHSRVNFIPMGLILIQLLFLFLIVKNVHHASVFLGLFLFFLGFVRVTKVYQGALRIQEALLVAFFLAGLVVLGSLQRWWLEPLLGSLNDSMLYYGATVLTAITDNAALTYLGSQVPNLTPAMKYALVAGAVSGGGLTVIANAPNPAGFGILKERFGVEGISPLWLLLYALVPTLVVVVCFGK